MRHRKKEQNTVNAEVVDTYKRRVALEECSAGNDGPPGPPGPPGLKGDIGGPSIASTNWRSCAFFKIDDGQDNGEVRTCSITKQYSDTYLYVAISGNLRVGYTNGACCRWYITFNGNECSDPDRIEAVTYAGGYSSYNLHRPRVFFGYCKSLSTGSISVGLRVGNCAGYGYYDCYTGWKSALSIMVEEITPSPYD
ncbi:collagen triple helix repeat-containing protein 1-like [Asterias rubens]|uniref:collagen triple helix repeat-containing protein 1-like n=1 Tax=Asterias rubens TaxID=7604 RepID=UPI001455873C|nr:collagen triple helix repeat-containing protein 1-like [Asterias rubens]